MATDIKTRYDNLHVTVERGVPASTIQQLFLILAEMAAYDAFLELKVLPWSD